MKVFRIKPINPGTYKLALILMCLFHASSLFGQSIVEGRIIDRADKKPIANASIFLGNTTIGAETDTDGTFILGKIKNGKYDLVVSVVGFQTYSQPLIVDQRKIILPDIALSRQVNALNPVTIRYKEDPNYQRFKKQFLGTSELADECVIVNPEILDLQYDEKTRLLTASSPEFLKIENRALGYKLNYLITNFTDNNIDTGKHELHFSGTVLFENMRGTPSDKRRWEKRRQQIYEGSEMHFLRAAAADKVEEEGFKAYQYVVYKNPARPSDSLIQMKIKSFKNFKTTYGDSISFWKDKQRLPKVIKTLSPYSLNRNEIVSATEYDNMFALGCNMDALYVVYNKTHHFPQKAQINHLDDRNNHERTLINFYSPYVFFWNNGRVVNNDSFSFTGAWAKYRVCGLLPLDYEPPKVSMPKQ